MLYSLKYLLSDKQLFTPSSLIKLMKIKMDVRVKESIVMISNINKHETELVYAFQSKITQHIKENLTWSREIKYFSDLCAFVKMLHFLVTIFT